MKRNTAQLEGTAHSSRVDEIEKHGIEQLSLRTIAKACGVTHVTPYRHFEDGEEAISRSFLAQLSHSFCQRNQ